MRPLFIVSFLVVGTVCAGQALHKKSAPQKPAEQLAFVCPDAEAQQACKSYQELLKAKDTSLPVGSAYICFRKHVDEFFAIKFSQPFFLKHWDETSKQMVTANTPSPGSGYTQTYKNGVQDTSIVPTFSFVGQWRPFPYSESGVFVSDVINMTKQDENDPNVGVSIDEAQVSVGFKYKNRFDKTMLYTLTIQRSTRRFAESCRAPGSVIERRICRGRQFFQAVSDMRKVATESCKPAATESTRLAAGPQGRSE